VSMPANAVVLGPFPYPEDAIVDGDTWARVEEYLVGAKEQIATHGWCQGNMYRDGKGTTLDQPTCVAGAVDATLIRKHVDVNHPDTCGALGIVYRVLARYMKQTAIKHNWLNPSDHRILIVTELNDKHMFNSDAIIEAFDAAIFYVRAVRVLQPAEQ